MIIETWRREGTFKRVKVCNGRIIAIGADGARIIEGKNERMVKGSWMCATCREDEVLLGGEGGLSDGSESREVGACDYKDHLAYALLDPFAVIIVKDEEKKVIPLNWYAPNVSWGKYLAIASYDGKVMLVQDDIIWEESLPGSVLSVKWRGDLLAVGVWRRGSSSVWVYEVKEKPRLLGATLLPSFTALAWSNERLVVATKTRLIFYKIHGNGGLEKVAELGLEEEIFDIDAAGSGIFVVTENGLRAFKVLL